MKRAKSTDDDDGGLDSLLDTMTNVVGILVLVLIVTQLGVNDAITQITANSNVTAEDVELARLELDTLDTQKKELEEQTKSLTPFDADAAREQLKRLQELLATRKKLLADQSKQTNEFAIALDRDRKTAAKNEKEIKDTKAKRQQLQADLDKALKQRAELQALLDRTPNRSGPAPAKVVTIPNPRPAPPGARQVTFVCAGNLLYPMNLDDIRKDAELRAKQLITRQRLNLDQKAGIDPAKFEKFYTKLKYATDQYFNVEYYISGNRWPRMKLTPKPGRGASDKELRRAGSRIRKQIAVLDPKKFYARLYVLPDSFDVYLTAREVLTEAGLLAGWDPQPEKWVYTTSVGGGIQLGPPLPPNPNPPPTKPAKPANVID